MSNENIMKFAWSSLFLGLFISSLLTLATGGVALLSEDKGQDTFNSIENLFSTQSQLSTVEAGLGGILDGGENPLAFDAVLAFINIGLFLFKIISFLVIVLVNFFTLSIWLSGSGAPSAIVGLLVMSWQFWTLYHLAKFIFKDRL